MIPPGTTSDQPLILRHGYARTTRESAPIRRGIVRGDFPVVIKFDAEALAADCERYLKTASGREFARRHFRQAAPEIR
jgi:hypothetical protein